MNNIPYKYETINKEKTRRTTRFTFIAFCVMLINAALDFARNIYPSALIILIMATITGIIVWLSYKGYSKFLVTSIIITTNTFLVLVTFAEGLKTGAYLYLLPQLFALTFLLSNEKVNILQMSVHFIVTTCCFCTCILFCNDTSNWQHISPELYHNMFIANSISVVLLCSAFAILGVYFEKQYRLALIEEKSKAEIQELKIRGQNKHLEDIAFTTSHVIRKPLANILALTDMLHNESFTDVHIKEVIAHLETSTQRLDEAVRDIIMKTRNDAEKA